MTSDKFYIKNTGICPICEKEVIFSSNHEWLRDHYFCSSCKSIPRERALMFVLNNTYKNWKNAVIHESSPGNRGASLKLKSECEKYISSQFFENASLGSNINGIRCENLELLTFDNDSIDIHISQDVMEHVFNPEKAFSEIARTLAPGGVHVFTVPLVNKWELTKRRALLDKDNKPIHLEEPVYHGNPISDGKSLVTMDWGYDICEYIFESSGLFTQIFYIDDIQKGIRAELIEVLVTRKPLNK